MGFSIPYTQEDHKSSYEFSIPGKMDEDEGEWTYLETEEGTIDSSLTEILNYFGDDGWELAFMQGLQSGGQWDYNNVEEFHYVFKRQPVKSG